MCTVQAGLSIYYTRTYTSTGFYSTWSPGSATLTPIASSSTIYYIVSKLVVTGVFTGTPESFNFGSMTTLFYMHTHLVVGYGATANEAMSAAVLAPAMTAAGMSVPTVKTDNLLTMNDLSQNLIEFGYNNTIRATYFSGINVAQDTKWFNVTATTEKLSVNFSKSDFPNKTIAVVHLTGYPTPQGGRAIMLVWGYEW